VIETNTASTQGEEPSMKPNEPSSVEGELQDFSLVLGGPLFQLLRRGHLSDDSLALLYRRIIVISLFCWLPLFLLSALEGRLLDGNVTVPFLWDWELHIRILVALPLLIAAELVVHRRMQPLTRQFMARQLIPDSAVGQFNAAIASALRLRNSVLAEALLIALVYLVGILFIWRQYIALDTATWYATVALEGSALSLAGKWYVYVSVPIFQFLLLRWYFRVFIWARFLWCVSRIKLRLLPMHPDGAGGLGFLGGQVIAFSPVLMAHGAMLAGLIASRIFYRSATLLEFKLEILILIVFLMGVVFGPLLVFTRQLENARRIGNGEYGVLAARYVREFDAKWLRGGAPASEQLIGNADIQSLADMGNSFGVVKTMNIVPFTKGSVMQLVALTVAPIVPLLLTMMPLEELLKKLLGLLV
jgi:hypothetical protein